jgi:acyl dehydratase
VPTYYWEDFSPGFFAEFGPRRVTREDIVAFARRYDPQPMHMDEEAAKASLLGGLSASGWHACAVATRLFVEGYINDAVSMGSPGVEEVKFLKPLRPDDVVTLRASVLETRASASRPGMGIVRMRCEMLNAARECILTLDIVQLLGRRSAATAGGEAVGGRRA